VRVTVELVHRALDGDVDAFDALVAGRIEQMVRLAMAIVGNEADARDATQDALATIWRELPSLRQPERFAAWADRILVNRCRLTLKRRGRRAVREFALPSDDPPGSPTASGPEGDVLRRQVLQAAFEELDADARALLVLHHLAELPLVEIAARREIPVGTAKSRLHAARQRLARALESEP
jgi:RNA polymerase sigma-70 factor, ECF subfamily